MLDRQHHPLNNPLIYPRFYLLDSGIKGAHYKKLEAGDNVCSSPQEEAFDDDFQR